jgi:hypothetical protein
MRYASIRMLGIFGGLAGILVSIAEFLLWVFSSGHTPAISTGAGIISPEVGALIFILLGIIGMISSLLYSESRMKMAQVILATGLLGFLIGLVSGGLLVGNWIYWIIPGTLLSTAGYIAMTTSKKVAY